MTLWSKGSRSVELDWYFDFISPYAYLQFEQFERLRSSADIRLRPVVLGALLSHWQTRGPAEIPGKRRWTYRHVQFRAEQLGIPFKMPPAHPFNPVRVLRLAILLQCNEEVVQEIFRFIWRDGQSVDSTDGWSTLCERLGARPTEEELTRVDVKDALRFNTQQAISLEIFGVPTFVLGREIFWGEDSLPLLQHCFAHPGWLKSDAIRRIDALPIGVRRS